MRINAGFGVLIAIALLMAAVGGWELTTIGREVGRLWSASEDASRNQQVVALSEKMRRLTLRLRTVWDEAAVAQYKEADGQAAELLGAAAQATFSEDHRRLYSETADLLAGQQKAFDRLSELVAQMKQDRVILFKVGDDLSTGVATLAQAARDDGRPEVIARSTDVEAAALLVGVANWRFLATSDPKGPETFNASLAKAGAAVQALQEMPDVQL
ncbi:MAG: hypothetical protein ACREFI_09760, partial [Stellaceae bacterium]